MCDRQRKPASREASYHHNADSAFRSFNEEFAIQINCYYNTIFNCNLSSRSALHEKIIDDIRNKVVLESVAIAALIMLI